VGRALGTLRPKELRYSMESVERTTEPKIVLLVRLLSAVDEGRHSFESLKDRIAEGAKRPSTRSLRRYLAVLADAGFPWYFDRPSNAYRFTDGYSLRRLDLSNGELFGLVALRSFGASIGGAIGASIDELTDKLLGSARSAVRTSVDKPSPVAFRLPEAQLDPQGERAFGLLASAERSTRSVRFVYQDKEGKRSTREADPYGFVVSAGRIYCVAFDHARHAIRTFAIDNVSEVDVLAQTFVKPQDFDVDVFAAGSISGVMHGGEATAVRVRFAPRVAKAAVAARIVAERELAHFDDGSVEIEYRVSDVEELARWVLSWGAEAEIVAPQSVRDRVASIARAIGEKYAVPVSP